MLLTTPARDFMARKRRGRSNIERRDTSVHWNVHQHVAPVAGQTREAAALRTEDKHDLLIGEIEIVKRRGASLVETHGPTSGALGALENVRYAADECDRQVFDCAGCRLRRRGRDVRGAMARHEHTGRTRGLRRTHNRAEIAWVGDTVERDEERVIGAEQRVEIRGA